MAAETTDIRQHLNIYSQPHCVASGCNNRLADLSAGPEVERGRICGQQITTVPNGSNHRHNPYTTSPNHVPNRTRTNQISEITAFAERLSQLSLQYP